MATTTIDEAEATSYRSCFPIFERKNYLNSCSLGPLSRASRDAVNDYADDWSEFGAPAWWLRWLPKIEEIQALFARAVGAEASSVTIHASISSAISSVGSCLDYRRRNKVIVSEIDFPTIAYGWLAKPDVEVAFARSADGISIPLEEYERLIDERTAAVATSHVFYATGALQDVKAIADMAHERGAVAIIDGYHAVGVMPVDVRTLGADFYMGGALKWLCGGPGLAFLYVSPAILSRVNPAISGWFAARDQFAFETTTFTRAETAGKFQLGTPAVCTVYTGIPGAKMVLDAGLDRIHERIRRLTDRATAAAIERGFELASPLDSKERGGIVMLRVKEPQRVVDGMTERGIVVDARPGKVRISPHFYNTECDVDQAMTALREIAGG